MNRGRSRPVWCALWTGVGLVCTCPGLEAEAGTSTKPYIPGTVPVLQALRVEKPPRIDGRLDEEVWQRAPVGGPLYDADKHPGQPMTEPTEFRVLYTPHALYIGVRCYDSDPSGIIGRVMERDGNIFLDDYIYMMLDTFHDRRNGYIFAINPAGARYDALVTDNFILNHDWNALWRARTHIDEQGWTVEIEIPFKSLSFNPALSTWGFNISRDIRRKFERGRWASPRREVKTYMPAEAGELTGLHGLKQGWGLEFTPYIKGRYEDGTGEGDLTGDAGFDFRYRLTPNLSATLSYNTDFAETEVDQRQINLTRFPLFFPEKRDFFLEDSGIFQFGGMTRRGGLRSPLLPYFSRRIGLSEDGRPVPILLAGKVAGRVGKYSLGIVDAVLDEHDDVGIENALVGRVSRQVMDESSVGGLLTFGDPNSPEDNVLVGPDFNFRTGEFLGGQLLEANVFALASYNQNSRSDYGYSYGLSVAYPNDLWQAQFDYVEIDEHFRPALGWVRQTGVRGYGVDLSYRPRPAWLPVVRHLTFSTHNEFYTDLENQLDNGQFMLFPLGADLESGDEFRIGLIQQFDRLTEDFEIVDGVIIPTGDYWWTRGGVTVELARKRMISGEVGAWFGGFYDGTREFYKAELNVLPWRHLGLSLDYTLNRISLPGGDFDTHLAAGRMRWNFTPDLGWSHLIQYDSESDSIGYNSRLQWEFRPGSKAFLVLNQNFVHEADGFQLDASEVVLKLVVVLRM